MTKKNEPTADNTFEQALLRLETLVKEMEEGKLSLEQMIAHFEEGTKLSDLCGKKLNDVERRIEILVKKGADIASEPFAPESETP